MGQSVRTLLVFQPQYLSVIKWSSNLMFEMFKELRKKVISRTAKYCPDFKSVSFVVCFFVLRFMLQLQLYLCHIWNNSCIIIIYFKKYCPWFQICFVCGVFFCWDFCYSCNSTSTVWHAIIIVISISRLSISSLHHPIPPPLTSEVFQFALDGA